MNKVLIYIYRRNSHACTMSLYHICYTCPERLNLFKLFLKHNKNLYVYFFLYFQKKLSLKMSFLQNSYTNYLASIYLLTHLRVHSFLTMIYFTQCVCYTYNQLELFSHIFSISAFTEFFVSFSLALWQSLYLSCFISIVID